MFNRDFFAKVRRKLDRVGELKKIVAYYSDAAAQNGNFGDFDKLKADTISYLKKMKVGDKTGVYKYSASTQEPNIYSSVYAAMILSLFGEMESLELNFKKEWIAYLDSFQGQDGFFYDSSIDNDIFYKEDWWGRRHLALHVIMAYSALGAKPKQHFTFLEEYYCEKHLLNFLEKLDFNNQQDVDHDNLLMNVAVLLQYSRDTFSDKRAAKSVAFIVDWLLNRLNPQTGLWGDFTPKNPGQISRAVQFYYHLYLILCYDGIAVPYLEKVIDWTLKTQNVFGGYGVALNSSSCEDIDSIDILCRLAKQTDYRKNDIRLSLNKALPWVLANRNGDGGYVFRRNEPFLYGHQQMSSLENESSMFATWFRTLSLAYLLPESGFKLGSCPGVDFL